ncbi:uncharacterized protein LOC133284173 [Gastrolobium bilobum]|uniref:uncharacterized protein LOC133284173 n=1 Tax=Gastrolobium bilobum TaxID=150636 RepID=UPI002AB0B850|nr:uncharacterized protein LOC133284173 [Gastrolobium bilobum]
MGKNEQQYLQQEEQSDSHASEASRCLVVVGAFSFKCLFVLILSLSALVSGLFWVFPRHSVTFSFDAKDVIKQSATVQTSFRLEKPVSQLIPYIERLEYEIYSEIALPNTKVAILSMHQSVAPNWTDVVFGVLSDPMNASINPVSLSVLRSTFVELFLQQSNLTLTTSIFGNVSIFEILKFTGGVTVIPPVQSASIWQIPQVLFNFTLNNSISEVLDNFDDFKDELKFGLGLKSDEHVYVQITNANGSTVAHPVIVQASVMQGFGSLLPQRLKQLAQTITGSAVGNLGLDNSVFGKVKEIRLSSFLKDTLHASSPSPAPSPQLIDHSESSISPYRAPSYPPVSPSTAEPPPCFDCEVSSPAPSTMIEHPPDPCPDSSFIYRPIPSPKSYSKPAVAPSSDSASHTTVKAPDLSRVAEVSRVSKLHQGEGRSKKLVYQLLAPSSLSSAGGDLGRGIMLMGFCMLISFVFLNDIMF